MLKKIVLITGIVLFVLVAAAIAIPFLFKDKIVAIVKKEANKNLNAVVEFDNDIGLSLFRRFPDITLTMDDLYVANIDSFAGDTLLKTKQLQLSLDIMSVFSDNMELNSFTLDNPIIYAKVLPSGKSNWDIAKTDEEAAAADTIPAEGTMKFTLKHWEINKATIVYDDRSLGMKMGLFGLDNSGSGDFTETIVNLKTELTAEKTQFIYEGIAYLDDVKTELNAAMRINLDSLRFDFEENELRLNDLPLSFNGWLAMPAEDIDMDISFATKDATFKSLLSLIPTIYQKDFDDLKAEGLMSFSGQVNGTYNEQSYPAFDIEMNVKDGMFQYPDLPQAVRDVQVNASVKSSSPGLEDMVINVQQIHAEMAGQPFDARILVREPMGDLYLDAAAKGNIALGAVNSFVKLEENTELSGDVMADLEIKGRMSSLENEQYEQFNASGEIRVSNLAYSSDDMPERIGMSNMQLIFSPQHAELRDMKATSGKSDISASGRLDNLIAYLFQDKTLTGSLNVQSNYLNLNPWIEEEETGETTATEQTARNQTAEDVGQSEEFEIPRNINFNLEASMKQVVFQHIDLRDIEGNVGLNQGMVTGTMRLRSDLIDLNPWMEEEEGGTAATTETAGADTATYELFEIPGYIDFTLDAFMKKVLFQDMVMENVAGIIIIKNKRAQLVDMRMNTLGGSFLASGSYATPTSEQADVSFDMMLENIGIGEAFKTFATVREFLPIAENLTGNFDGQVSFNSVLGKDFMPDWSTLTSDGKLEIERAVIENFVPLQRLAKKLNMPKYKQLVLTGIKPSYEISNGRFSLKEPITFDVEETDFEITGSSGIDKTLAYNIAMDVPAGEMKAQANQLLTQALGSDVKLSSGDKVKVIAKMTGTTDNPQISLDLSQTGKGLIENVTETVKEKVEDVIGDKKQEAEDKARQELDKQKEELERKKREAEQKAREEAERKRKEAEEKAKEEAKKKLKNVFK
ncbi:MAG: AsmA-like C-terminal region-containing protein [Bacteroidia bacterium]